MYYVNFSSIYLQEKQKFFLRHLLGLLWQSFEKFIIEKKAYLAKEN